MKTVVMEKLALYTKCLGTMFILLSLYSCQTTPVEETRAEAVNEIEASLLASDQFNAKAEKPDNYFIDKPGSPTNVNENKTAISSRSSAGSQALGSQNETTINEKRFNLSVDQAEVRPLLMSLVRGTQLNMVVHPDVSGKVSLSLNRVTADEVMQALRNVYGYEYRKTSRGYEVLPPSLQSQMYFVNYLNIQRSGLSTIRVSSGQISEGATVKENQTSKKSGNTVSGSRIETRVKSDFWAEVREAITALIGDSDGRKVVVNSQSGVVVVRAMPDELRMVARYLAATQSIMQRQVILEAKILEVELNDKFQAGVNWAAFLGSGDNTALVGQTGGGSVFNGSGYSELAGKTLDLIPGEIPLGNGIPTSAFGGTFAMAINLTNFSAFIELLQAQGDVNVLSSPRISTVNNQKAIIKVGEDEFFVTDITTETLNAGVNINQSVNVELTPFFTGVALDVIPQIDNKGIVTLYIHPSVSKVDEKVKEIAVSLENFLKIPLAISTIRETDSIVRAASGQVVVIGGLMQTLSQDVRSGIPFLSELPVLGGLFRHQKTVTRKTELVILLRPIVVDDNSVWNENISSSAKNVTQVVNSK